MPLAEPERIREDFHHNVRRDTPLDHYSDPLKEFFKRHAGEKTKEFMELQALIEQDRRLLLLNFEHKQFGNVNTIALVQAAKSNLAILAASEKTLGDGRIRAKPPNTVGKADLGAEGPYLARSRSYWEKFITSTKTRDFIKPIQHLWPEKPSDWWRNSETRQKQVLSKALEISLKRGRSKATGNAAIFEELEGLRNDAARQAEMRLYSAYKKAAGID